MLNRIHLIHIRYVLVNWIVKIILTQNEKVKLINFILS